MKNVAFLLDPDDYWVEYVSLPYLLFFSFPIGGKFLADSGESIGLSRMRKSSLGWSGKPVFYLLVVIKATSLVITRLGES